MEKDCSGCGHNSGCHYHLLPLALNKKPFNGVTGPQEVVKGDINPGNNKARLILANNSVIVLDTLANGALAQQGNTQISKCDNGQLSYTTTETTPNTNSTTALLFNTVEVPRGGQYKLILADGTEVWLNAASSLRFPVAFTGNERIVELDGEGYFEVAKDAARPFTVRTKRADVQVLGTHFNVCAYAGEDWKTTLLEGKVAAKRNAAQALLTPGNQAILAVNEETFRIVPNADLDEAIAWKEGFFSSMMPA
ncbi:FecR family protein [Paraflavitalea speifideaquila]|uniref:FecR family protein n=1 Tax=Paraflavitalea speifideaquila TaxID=3076558 RepID=UPI0028E33742|nr:FecR domain-containing protein [Paraflavitalea speifideiaquila]